MDSVIGFLSWPQSKSKRPTVEADPSLVLSLGIFHQLIGIGLLLVAVLYLSKTKNTRDLPTAG
jgi:hypothetical protein